MSSGNCVQIDIIKFVYYYLGMATVVQIQNYISMVYPVAQRVCKNKGLPDHLAKVCLIQGALESGYGTSSVMIEHNALFGVKVTDDDIKYNRYYVTNTTEYDRSLKKYVVVQARFRSFSDLTENIEHYFNLITNKRYGACVYSKDVKEALTIIWSSGYATAPDYVEKCIGVEKILDKYISYTTDVNYIVNTERDNLNVREKPNGNIITSLPKGTKIYCDDEWYYVPSLNGFVSNKYLKKLREI